MRDVMRASRTGVASMVAAVVLFGLASCSGGSDGRSTVGTAGLPAPDGNLPGFGVVLSAESATYEYTIPVGAGEALDAGEPLTILPRSLTTTVGQTIRIVNDDVRGHTVGPWFVGAHETLRQEFTTPGSYEGLCTVRPSGEFVLQVLAR